MFGALLAAVPAWLVWVLAVAGVGAGLVVVAVLRKRAEAFTPYAAAIGDEMCLKRVRGGWWRRQGGGMRQARCHCQQ